MILIRVALDTSKPHLAFLSEECDLKKVSRLEYDTRVVDMELEKTLLAGVYSFNNKEKRDLFTRQCNGTSSEREICFPAMLAV